MTDDYTPEELKRWCRLAGMELKKSTLLPHKMCVRRRPFATLYDDDPFLLAGVAAILVARVRNEYVLDYSVDSGHPDVCRVDFSDEPTTHGVTVTERGKAGEWLAVTCRAAVAVLEGADG